MDWSFIQKFAPMYVEAGLLTVTIGVFGIVLSVAIGLVCALVKYYRIPVARQIVAAYIELSRNTPLIVQLFFLYFGLPKAGILLSSEACGVIGLAFLAGLTAYPKFSAMWKKIPLLIAGLAVAYAFGTVWFMISTGTGLIPSLMLCVVPYIPFDLAKLALTLGLSSLVRSRLGKRVKV